MKPIEKTAMNIPGSHSGGYAKNRKVRVTMNKQLLRLYTLSITFLMVNLLGLTGCAPAVVAEGQPKSTPNASGTLPPYPGPTQFNSPSLTLSPMPTQANRGWNVTPLPEEQMIRGEIVEIPPTASP